MPGRGALIGRESERERLGTALRRATHGAGSIVLVAGEAGIGKTWLCPGPRQGSRGSDPLEPRPWCTTGSSPTTIAEMVSAGWPNVIASLKTLRETGDPLPA